MQFGNPFKQESLGLAAEVNARYGGIGENFCTEMAVVLEEQINDTFSDIEVKLNNELGPMFDALHLGRLNVKVESKVTLTFTEDEDE